MIGILDCTLRDGGYINDWDFDYNTSMDIVDLASQAHIDVIEIGFIDEECNNAKEKTKFQSFDEINYFLEECYLKGVICDNNIVAMIMLGKVDLDSIQPRNKSHLKGIRLCFKKNQISEMIPMAKRIVECGYDLYLQPASITDYDDETFIELVEFANSTITKAFYIVDTYGLMQKEDVLHYLRLLIERLNEDIFIGFHSHNNLQLSFSNSQYFIEYGRKRNLLIDSSVMGMGRGAGNLCTELITKYINDNIVSKKYDLIPILRIVDGFIQPLFQRYAWGYSVPYYLAAINFCHPNYATFLSNKDSLSVEIISEIMNSIPEDKKRSYDEDLIHNIYMNYLSDDNEGNIEDYLSRKIKGKKVVLIAPGKQVEICKEKIAEIVKSDDVYSISLNSYEKMFEVDAIILNNEKRLEQFDLNDIREREIDLITTSNVKVDANISRICFDMRRYVRNNIDFMGVVVLDILQKVGVKEVLLAGYDGFSTSARESYLSSINVTNVDAEVNEFRNEIIAQKIEQMRKYMTIRFITPSQYLND